MTKAAGANATGGCRGYLLHSTIGLERMPGGPPEPDCLGDACILGRADDERDIGGGQGCTNLVQTVSVACLQSDVVKRQCRPLYVLHRMVRDAVCGDRTGMGQV